jgi:hydrogenase-4 component B
VENIGIILIGVGAALLAVTHGDALWGRLALAGALLHVWNHGAVQVAAVLRRRFGAARHGHAGDEPARRIVARDAVDGRAVRARRGRRFGPAAAQWICQRMAGLSRAVRRGDEQRASAWAAMPAAIMLAMAGALALASFAKAGAVIFLGAPRTQAARTRTNAAVDARADAGAGGRVRGDRPGAGFVLAGGRARGGKLASRLGGLRWKRPRRWTLGAVQVALAILVLAAAAWLWRRGARQRPARGLTWDCGYAAPTARMQYTSASFAGIAAGWFAGFLQPERKMRRPRGPFPAEPSVWNA